MTYKATFELPHNQQAVMRLRANSYEDALRQTRGLGRLLGLKPLKMDEMDGQHVVSTSTIYS